MTTTADYTYSFQKNILCIVDLNTGNISVTNSIKDVVNQITKNEMVNPKNLTIIYQDSQGNWDGWDHETEMFFFLNAKSMEEAIQLITI